jgi:hypothetical protein
MPGLGSANRHLADTHGGGLDRSEGIGQYAVPWGQPLAQVANAWQQPGANILKTGHAGYYMKNRYDAISPREAQNIPGFTPNSAPPMSIGATHLSMNKSNSGCSGNTCQANPKTQATQSSASTNHIAQRFLPNGQTDFAREMQGMPAPPVLYPRESYSYQDAPLLSSNVQIEAMRRRGGGASLANEQQGVMSPSLNFSVANDSAAGNRAPVEARSSNTITLVIPMAAFEVISIIGGLLLLTLLIFAVKGFMDFASS